MSHFLVFGTHPRLSLAEFRAVKPRLPKPTLVGACAVVSDPAWDGAALMERLGGTVKLGDVLGTVDTEQLNGEEIVEMITGSGKREAGSGKSRDQKLPFALTIVGGSNSAARVKRVAMEMKKALQKKGASARWVTSEGGGNASPAAVAKLKMTSEGCDVVVIIEGKRAHVGRTTHVQDATAWSERDYGRPARDDRAGMLPPKLARMMVNLAELPKGGTLFDPFCGNGTILMEAALATHAARIVGSDIEEKQVATTEENDRWLAARGILDRAAAAKIEAFACDARRASAKVAASSVDAIATEGMLGPPLRGGEPLAAIKKTAEEIEALWRAGLADWKKILKTRGRIVGVWPSFKTTGGMARVELDRDLAKLGYRLVNPLEGWDDSGSPLLYHREGQHVARRIVVLEKT